MKYHAQQTSMWDAWYLNIKGRIHAFHLQNPLKDCTLPETTDWCVGHAVSDDLLHWQQCAGVLPPLKDDANPQDYHAKYTGGAAEKDGKFFLYYTMRDKDGGTQRIGAALSDDGYQWTIHPGNPVLEPDPDIFIGYGKRNCDWGIVDCRDLVVVRNPDDGLYYGYFAAAAVVAGRMSPVGVIGVAVSRDLLNWEQQSIVYVPRSNGMAEVPDVYCIDGKWYLTILTGTNYCGRAATADEYVTNCTIYAVADNPRGPFVEPDDNILIGGIFQSGFSCRTVEKEGKRYVLYTDRPGSMVVKRDGLCFDQPATLSLPKEIRVDAGGRLGAYWTPLVEKLRTRQLISPTSPPELTERPQNSFAWKTFGGHYTRNGGRYTGQAVGCNWQAAGFQLGAKNIEYNVDVTLRDAKAAGLWIASRDDGWCRNYVIMLEPGKRRVLLTKFYDFDYYAAREYPFVPDMAYALKLVLVDGICELYVNGQLLLQCGIEALAVNHAGLFCDRGNAEFENISLYALED
jgi:beta-fructofuranosidase